MKDIEKAMKLAYEAHDGQVDLDGNPVIFHPVTVALLGKTKEETIVGLLHDVVEDTDYTFADLEDMGFSENVIDALKLLTHEKGVPYEDYIRRIGESGNALAINVKRNDLTHNLCRGKKGGHEKQVKKHTRGYELLCSLTE